MTDNGWNIIDQQHTPHQLPDAERQAFRDHIAKCVSGMQWANMLQRALDDADHWRQVAQRHADETARAAAAHRAEESDSELAGEVELLRDRVRTLQAQLDAQPQVEAVGWAVSEGPIDDGNWWADEKECPPGFRRRVYLGPAEPIESEVPNA